MSEESRVSGNRRNGKTSKTVYTQYGKVTVETSCGRDGSFNPQTVRKRETILAEGMVDQIVGMYTFDMSTHRISRYFEREFNTRLSAEAISAITDRVRPEIKEWKSRSLDVVYAIQNVFPNTAAQLCIVHQIRSSVNNFDSKHQKGFLKDLKLVFGTVSKDAAKTELDSLDAKWGERYNIVIRSWRDNWERLVEFFQCTKEIRRLIYTANTVEGYHR